jgi:spheroidene monooxygenase
MPANRIEWARESAPPLAREPVRPPAAPDPRPHAQAVASPRRIAGWPLLVLAQSRPTWADRAWGWRQVAFGAMRARHSLAGLLFVRSLGSGHEGGFGLRPSIDRHGLFLVFDTPARVREFVAESALLARYRQRSLECGVLQLRITRARGSWGGVGIEPVANADPLAAVAERPLVALTRASIRPLRAASFWRHAPPSQAALAGAAGCRLAVGLGEAPLLRQCTVSWWDSAAAMDAYARQGAHQQAIAASRQDGFFSESMFLRFELLAAEGWWQGRDLGAAAGGPA